MSTTPVPKGAQGRIPGDAAALVVAGPTRRLPDTPAPRGWEHDRPEIVVLTGEEDPERPGWIAEALLRRGKQVADVLGAIGLDAVHIVRPETTTGSSRRW